MSRRSFTMKMEADALEAWRSLSTRTGVSMTALVEVLGGSLLSDELKLPKTVIDKARALDAERRRRGDR